MARGKRRIGMDVIDQQIEAAQDEVIKAKQKYDAATDRLKELLDRKKALQTEELMAAVMKSKRSYEDILRFINSETEGE
jgi:hypothetical protein